MSGKVERRRGIGMRAKAVVIGLFCLGLAAETCSMAAAADRHMVQVRRLNEQEYRHSIADIFGPQIAFAGMFEPDTRIDGLLSTSGTVLSITPSGFSALSGMADTIAAQVVNEKNRAKLIGCKPKSDKDADHACASEVMVSSSLRSSPSPRRSSSSRSWRRRSSSSRIPEER